MAGYAVSQPLPRAFDAAVSLGPNCLAAYRIAKAGFKRRSFPFDVMMSGSDGWPAGEKAVWQAPVGLRLVVECLLREPAFEGYVSKMEPLPQINAVGNCGFVEPGGGFIPSAHIHDDPREAAVAETYARRALRLLRLLGDSDYRILFLYTLRLRDISNPKHFITIAQGLPLEVARLRDALQRRWPQLDSKLLVVVLGELPNCVPLAAQKALEACISRIHSVNEMRHSENAADAETLTRLNWVTVERIADAPAGPHPMDGFWGDDGAWTELFSRYPVVPRDFGEPCFADATKAGIPKSAVGEGHDGDAKFEQFVASLGMVKPA